MIRIVLVILLVLIGLVILDVILAFARPGLNGIPFTVALISIIGRKRDFRKRCVKVEHDMTAEELLRLIKIGRPIYQREQGNGVRIYNDLSKDVKIEYLGSANHPIKDQFFVMKPNAVVVVETNSLIRVVG